MNRIGRLLFVCILFFTTSGLWAQTSRTAPDSVTVSGRIRNLTVQLYRQSPNITVSRNNILQASREMARPAALQPDGSFSVTVPLIYPYEELYFNFGQISTVFLASPGQVEIALDADSLFIAAIPFRFGGTNAQVNNQLARFKAFEFKNKSRINGQQLSQQLYNRTAEDSRKILKSEFIRTYDKFRQTNQVLPLLDQYIRSTIRYEAASFLYDKAAAEQDNRLEINLSLDSLRSPTDLFMSVQRATTMDRFVAYVNSRLSQQAQAAVGRGRGIPIKTLASLVNQYVTNLSEADRNRIQELMNQNSGNNRDLALLQRMLETHSDTLSKIVLYEMTMAQCRRMVDTTGLDFLKANFLAQNLTTSELFAQKLLYRHILPQVADPRYRLSAEELYRLAVKDSVVVRQVAERFSVNSYEKPVEVLPEVTMLRTDRTGRQLLDLLREQAQARLVYVLAWSTDAENSRQELLASRALQERLSSRDVLLVYACTNETDARLWRESVAKNPVKGLHLYLNDFQMTDLLLQLRADDIPAAGIIERDGKVYRRNVPLPSKTDEALRLIQEKL